MHIVDTHCHLDAAEFGDQHAEIVIEAVACDVRTIIIPAVSYSNFSAVKALCLRHDNCLAAYGIHPLLVGQAEEGDLPKLRATLEQERAVAVGEIGLDFFVDNYDRERQEYYFAEQLKLAHEFDLPVLLHVRRAQDTVLKHLRRIKVNGGIAHAFNGSRQQADEFIKLGFKLGFGGAMTHTRALRIRELAATLPMESIVLETDGPDIPPDFLPRGVPNRPANLQRIAMTLAELRGMSLKEVAAETTANAASVLPMLRKRLQAL